MESQHGYPDALLRLRELALEVPLPQSKEFLGHIDQIKCWVQMQGWQLRKAYDILEDAHLVVKNLEFALWATEMERDELLEDLRRFLYGE